MIVRTSCVICVIVLCSVIQKSSSNPTPERGHRDQQGPCVGMDCLHGVLMHGDEAPGQGHTAEDQYLRFKSVLDTEQPQAGPLDAEQLLHGVLMHGDSEPGKHHEEIADIQPKEVSQSGPQDLSEVIHEGMHGEEGNFKHHHRDEEPVKDEKQGPYEEKMMHGVLMHGDANFVHTEDSGKETELSDDLERKIGPQDADEYLHGVLMHGDSAPGQEYNHESSGLSSIDLGAAGPNNDLHGILMHGDSSFGVDHTHEDNELEHEVFRDISKILELGLDEDLLKIIDLEKILEQDRQEYAEFISNNPQYIDESIIGSTIAEVSDSILADIELMKKRYLAKTNNFESDEGEITQPLEDIPFTAEDAIAMLDEGAHADEGEDMRHDLELLGSTEPINARHKAKQAMLRQH